MKLEKVILREKHHRKSDIRKWIADGLAQVNEETVTDPSYKVMKHDRVTLRGEVVVSKMLHYLMLNKPRGVVSATLDDGHETVVDLIDEEFADQLHIAGRLDKESTGLLILTNDGTWSRRITEPEMRIPKRYLVTTATAILVADRSKFEQGIYFAYEDITTLPAELEILSENSAIVTLYEGKYHQIKRMFHAIGNRVTSLQRLSIGKLELDANLATSQYRVLTEEEIALF